MKKHLNDVTDFVELELHLMTAATYFCDFSVIYPLFNNDSVIVKALQKKDLISAKNLLDRYYDIDELSESEWAAITNVYKEIEQNYRSKLKTELLPLPKEFLVMLGNKAVEINNFSTASTVFEQLNNLDKRINELTDNGIRQLKSKELKDSIHPSDKALTDAVIEEKIKQAALYFFKAMKLIHPISLDFQNIGIQFILNEKAPLKRRYDRYVEQAVLRELLVAGIEYLIYENSIHSKIIQALDAIQAPGKIIRQLLKELAILFSGGPENYGHFVKNYQAAAEYLENPESEINIIKTQEILLGRTVGDGNYFQYLKEITTQFPISALLIACNDTSYNIKYIAPRFAKSVTLLELFGLDK